ncbi:hypothetical protein KA005_80150, partial [bacterium]|nr:hypothetical protein [bacterium]
PGLPPDCCEELRIRHHLDHTTMLSKTSALEGGIGENHKDIIALQKQVNELEFQCDHTHPKFFKWLGWIK